jgi:nucleotide-binding universal stress UspA family protein
MLFVEDPLLAQAEHIVSPSPDLAGELRAFLAGTGDLDLPREPQLHLTIGEPDVEIVACATRERVDLIVMGAHGLTGVRKAYFGSTTARVLRRTTVPLLVVPGTVDVGKARDLEGLGAILALSDFGPAASAAADVAADVAHAIRVPLVVVHVMPSVSVPQSWRPRAIAAMQRRSAAAHEAMCREMTRLERRGPLESAIVDGSIAEGVAELARARHAGLIVLGLERTDTGRRPGSTAYPVICAAPVPVLAVPVPDTE